jgi:hypothetical protein
LPYGEFSALQATKFYRGLLEASAADKSLSIGIRSAFDFNNRTQRKLLESIDQLLIRIEQNNFYSLDIQAFHVLIDSVKYESHEAIILAKSRNEPIYYLFYSTHTLKEFL